MVRRIAFIVAGAATAGLLAVGSAAADSVDADAHHASSTQVQVGDVWVNTEASTYYGFHVSD